MLSFDMSIESGIRQIPLATSAPEVSPLIVILRSSFMLLLLPTLSDRAILIHRVCDVLTPLLAILQLIHDNVVFVVVLRRRQVLAKE